MLVPFCFLVRFISVFCVRGVTCFSLSRLRAAKLAQRKARRRSPVTRLCACVRRAFLSLSSLCALPIMSLLPIKTQTYLRGKQIRTAVTFGCIVFVMSFLCAKSMSVEHALCILILNVSACTPTSFHLPRFLSQWRPKLRATCASVSYAI